MENTITTEEFLEDLTGKPREKSSPDAEVSKKRGVAPTLIIGIGGTGIEVVGRLKKHLRVHYHGYEQPADMIKFLLFDTISITKQDRELAEVFSESEEEYINLSSNFNAFAYLQENYSKDQDLRKWWDNRYSVSPQYQEWGAKRVRQLGRLFLHNKHLQVEAVIQKKVQDTCTIFEDLVRDQNLSEVGSNFRVYIVTSSCGGTGSGIFLDILYKIWRAVLTQGRIPEIRAFMFLPGIFEEEARKSSLELVQAHRANAYAFLKEIDYFLSPEGDINKYILDAVTRDSSQKVNIPPGSLIKYGYLIDRQLGNLGNLDKPEDAYNLVSDAMYQMIITPVGQDEEGVGLTNIDTIVDPTHLRKGKRTAYSSLGLSRILFPRSTLHAQLTYNFLRDVIFSGLTANYSWMDEALQKDERVKGLISALGDRNFLSLDELSRPALNLVTQCPSQTDLQSTEMAVRIDKLTKEKDLNENRVADGLAAIDERFKQFEKETIQNGKEALINMVNNSEFGVSYAQKVLQIVRSRLRDRLEEVRVLRRQEESAKADSEKEINDNISEIERSVSKRAVAFKNSSVNKKSAHIASLIRAYTESAISAKILEKKQVLLEALVGQEQLTEEHLIDKEIVLRRKVQRSLIDSEIDNLGRLIDKLNRLGDRTEEKIRDRRLSDEDAGATITTQMFPTNVLNFMKSTELNALYQDNLHSSKMHKHVKVILNGLSDSVEYGVDGIYQMSDDEDEITVKKVLISITADRARSLFKSILSKDVVETALGSISNEKFENQVMSNLFELSQPCWNYDLQKANDPGITELPRTYSLGYDHPETLPIPEGQNQPGLVRTKNNHQITLLQAQHGLPLFALRLLPSFRADYKQYMRQAKADGRQPLHLDLRWSRNIDSIPDLKVAIEIDDLMLLEFALGLFFDYLLIKGDVEMTEITKKRPIDKNDLRGYIHSVNGKDYFIAKYTAADGIFLADGFERLSSSGRQDAAEAYANHADSELVTQVLKELGKKKQYALVKDVAVYLERIIVPEINRAEDDEERGVLEREYKVLKKFMDDLDYRQEQGLPLAG